MALGINGNYNSIINLEKGEANANLRALIDSRGFSCLQNRGGRLYPVSGAWGRVLKFLGKLGDVKGAVNETLRALNQALEQGAPQNQEFANHLKKRLSRLDLSQFDRGVIKEGSALETLLISKEYREARANYRESPNDEQRLIAYALAEVKFVQELGIELKSIGLGSTGAKFGVNRFGKAIVVIKTTEQGSFFRRHLNPPKMDIDAEISFYLIDRKNQIGIVPPTTAAEVSSTTFYGEQTRRCSVQVFVDRSRTLREAMEVPSFIRFFPRGFVKWFFKRRREEQLNALPRELLYRAAWHDTLSENQDGHLDNFLLTQRGADPDWSDPAFFEKGHYQGAIRQFLTPSENGTILAAIDGGGSACSRARWAPYRHYIETLLPDADVFRASFESSHPERVNFNL